MLIYLGRISYGLYVFHVLGLLISDHVVSRSNRESLSLFAASRGCADRDHSHGGRVVSLAGDAVPESEAAVHARSFASGRIEGIAGKFGSETEGGS